MPLERAAEPRAEAAFRLGLVSGNPAHLRVRLCASQGAAEAGAETAFRLGREGLLVEAAREREPGKKAVPHQDLAEQAAGALLLVERRLELASRQQAALDEELAEGTQ